MSNIPLTSKESQSESTWLRRLGRVSTTAFLVRGAGVILLFVVEVVIARLAGPTEFGIYAEIFAILNLAVLVAKVGTDTAAIRFISTYRSRGDEERVSAFIGYAFQLVLSTAVGLAGLWAASALIVGTLDESRNVIPFVIGSLSLPCFAVMRLCEGIFRGLNRTSMALLPFAVVYPAVFLVLLLASDAWGVEKLTATRISVIQVIAFSVPALAACWSVLHGRTIARATIAVRKEWLSSSVTLLAYGGFAIILGQVDTLMVGAMRGPDAAASYAVAWRVASLLGAFLIALNFGLAPIVATWYEQGRLLQLERLLRKALRGVILCSALAALVLVIFNQRILSLFGGEYVEARATLFVLVACQLVNVLGGPVGILLNMTGNTRYAVIILGVAAIFNLAGNIVLISMFGGFGAAISTTISTVGWNVGFGLTARRRLGIRLMV